MGLISRAPAVEQLWWLVRTDTLHIHQPAPPVCALHVCAACRCWPACVELVLRLALCWSISVGQGPHSIVPLRQVPPHHYCSFSRACCIISPPHTDNCMSPPWRARVRGSAAACFVMCAEQCELERADCVQESVFARCWLWREAVLRRRAASPRACPLVSQVMFRILCVCCSSKTYWPAVLEWLVWPAASPAVCALSHYGRGEIYMLVGWPSCSARVCWCVGADCHPVFFGNRPSFLPAGLSCMCGWVCCTGVLL